MDKTKLAYKIINFFRPKGLTDEQEVKILTKINSCTKEEYEGWKLIVEKIDDHDTKIMSVVNTLRERRIKKVADWKEKSVNNLGFNLTKDGLTASLDDFLDKELKAIFDDDYPDEEQKK